MSGQAILLKFKGPVYHSHHDEESFFAWLGKIPSVTDIGGELEDVHVTVDLDDLDDGQLQDLIGLHMRYRLPMRHLTVLETPKNSKFFRDKDMYWHDYVFGDRVPA